MKFIKGITAISEDMSWNWFTAVRPTNHDHLINTLDKNQKSMKLTLIQTKSGISCNPVNLKAEIAMGDGIAQNIYTTKFSRIVVNRVTLDIVINNYLTSCDKY